jgi:integrase
MVFITSGKVYKTRLPLGEGRTITLSTGARDLTDAEEVEAVVRDWLGRNGQRKAQPALIAALAAKRVTLRDAYLAHVELRLKDLLDRLAAESNAAANAAERDAEDPDLSPLVEEWQAWKAKQKKGKKGRVAMDGPRTSIADDYHTKVRVLFPLGTEIRASALTPPAIASRLDRLSVQGPTKNRYRTAVSQFCKYLVRRGLLATNPVRDVEGFGENDERLVYYEIDDAKALLAVLPQPSAGVAAFALGFGAEWEAIQGARGIDLEVTGKGRAQTVTALVRGTKRAWRRRTVPLVPELRWLLPYLRDAFNAAGDGPVFPGLTKTMALKRQRKVATTAGIEAEGEDRFSQHDLHDWRHTHAVALLRWGYAEQIVAAHLGHKNTDLVRTRYGVFIPKSTDYRKR